MIIITNDRIPGKRIVRTLGLVRGNSVRARHVGRDILAVLKNIVGGEVHSLGANAVIGTRFITAQVATGMAELLAYGTAVVVQDE